MLVGYARTSTVEQEAGLEAQLRDLKAHGCEEIFSEQVSSVQHRDELEKALRFIRKGDTLVVTKLDRLARSVMDLLTIQKRIEQKEANLSILNMNLDTKTPTGRLMLTLIGSIAQFEREIMLERQREGIAKAKAEGKYKGRAATARAKAQQVVDLRRSGKGATEIAQETGIGRASVYRILAEHPL
jgi:DNA invertase Pin-like site-specific DNA recombinase